MALLAKVKKVTGMESSHEPKPKFSSIMTENRQPAPEAGLGTDGGRKQKGFWKWAALHFPAFRKGEYDLARAEEKYGIEEEIHWLDSDVPAPDVLPAAEEQQEHDILNKGQSVQPKDSPITSENGHPDLSADAAKTDGGRKKTGRERKKKNRFWKWPAFHFPCISGKSYDLADVEERFGIEAETRRRDRDGWSVHKPCVQPKDTATRSDEVPGSAVGGEEVLLTPEQQLVQGILDKGHIRHRYKIGPMLGEGGCGTVYRGIRCKDGLKVAVKCAEKLPDVPSIRVPGQRKRVPIEVGLMLMANKGPSVPHIIELLDWEDDKDHYVMVMESPVPCVDLFDFVEGHGGSLDEGTARKIMRQVIDAAKTCCERGVFHRDIKLDNLLVNQDTMEVKLIDFGCGALMKKSAFKYFIGTRPYCPPEFFTKGRYHAKPTTVWTLGLVLYGMLCGGCPTSDDHYTMTVNLWNRPGLSKECCLMICDCLQTNPKKRLSLDEMHLHDWFKVTE